MKKLVFPVLLLFSLTASAQFITNNGIDIVNTGVVYTNGDWVNSGAIKNDGSIITTDNFTNNGTLDPASTGGFVLKLAADKTFKPGGTTFGFLVKEGVGNASVSGQFSVKDSLSIQGGLITPVTATDIVTVAETGTVKSVPGSFLEGGNLVRKGTGDLFFPVGKNGVALPITFLNVSGTNPTISVTVADAPTGYTGGAGVNQLIDFPYVWKAVKTNVADSSYVELAYPTSISAATDVVVVRKRTDGNVYEGMGARAVTSNAGTIKIRSYSRGAQGTFSVAKGFPGNLETDRLALLALYDATDGDNSWTNKTNWKNADVTTWAGVTETGGYITAINLPNNKLTGPVPPELADLGGLQSIDLSNNKLTKLPDLSDISGLASLNVSKNSLDFASLIPNVSIPGINYADQALLTTGDTTLVDVGTSPTFEIVTEGEGNIYQWSYNDTPIVGATTPSYQINTIGRTNMGNYVVKVTNPAVPNLTLTSGNKRVLATASITGTVFEEGTTPMNDGVLTLYKVTPIGAYEKAQENVPVKTDGSYNLEKIVLDDYVLLAEADASTYPNDLPTYYKNTTYWEEADKILLNENQSGLNITMQKKPTEKPNGTGSISGTFEDTNPEGGKTDANKRIANAGVSIRRKTNTGRPQDEGLKIIAYTETDEGGQFAFEKLEPGEYLLNLQFPGYPMDPTSDINITLGTTSTDRKALVEAVVKDNKIVVKQLTITGWDDTETRFTVFPNPATTAFSIKVLQRMDGLSYSISNSMGQEVLQNNISSGGTEEVNASSLSPGVYLVRIAQHGSTIQTFRIVIN